MYAFSLVALMLLSIFASLSGLIAQEENSVNELADDSVQMEATSPGHPVFTEYVGAHWCGPCHSMSANLHSVYGTNGGGGSQSEDFTYVSFWESATTGWPADGPINRRAHISPTYFPTSVYGDADVSDTTYYTSNRDVASLYETGGDMSNPNDYSMRVVQSENGNNMDIDITATYTGSGSKTVYIYAAVTEATSPEAYSGSPNPYPHHVWQDWLLNSAGTGFESVTLTSGNSVTKSWSKPISTVRAGGGVTAAENFLTVGALLDGDHTTNRGVLSASDSHMGPKIDIGVTSFTVNNPASSAGYVRGDTLTLDATVKNVGDVDYTDAGTVELYYLENNNPVVVKSASVGTLPVVGANTMTLSVDLDSTNYPEGEYTKTFGARITGLVGDSSSNNNQATLDFNHDRPPITKSPQIVGEQLVERGSTAIVLAKSDTSNTNDFVDDVTSTTFNVEVSPTGLDQWFSSVVSGGQNVVSLGSPNEGREYTITPSAAMSAGWYDVRIQAIDSRGQTGSWMSITGSSGFELQNGMPQVITDPIPSVMCDTLTNVSMVGHIVDPETPLQDLIVTSSDDSFVAWHPTSKELEVKFQWSEINGCSLGQQSIEIEIDDGGDYSESGQLPYGTLHFNVVENGQPRWMGLPSQTIAEGGNGILALLPFLTDTDNTGQSVDASQLTLELISNSNEGAIEATLTGKTIGFQTIDDDVNGVTILTIRASDGEKTSEATLTINIQPINDAPRISPFYNTDCDNTELGENFDPCNLELLDDLKRSQEFSFDLSSRVVDVDNPSSEAFITVTSSEPGAARYSFLDGFLTLQFETLGMQTVTISVQDKYDTKIYVMNVNVIDSLSFEVSKLNDGSGHLYVGLEDTYIGQTPTVSMALTPNAPSFTSINVTWNVCNALTGTCDGILKENLDMSTGSWSTELEIPSVIAAGAFAREDGSKFMDYYALSIAAEDASSKYKTMSIFKWDITESLPAIEDMSDQLLESYIDDLTAEKIELTTQIDDAAVEEDTTSLEGKLSEVEAELELACVDPRATCVDNSESSTISLSESSELNIMVIGIIAGVILVGVLLTLLITRRNKDDVKIDEWNDTGWNPNMVPAADSVANSMYGGSQSLFQQPVAIPAPAVPLAGPPLPLSGLPAGWTMEQWAYYGQQYLDGTL